MSPSIPYGQGEAFFTFTFVDRTGDFQTKNHPKMMPLPQRDRRALTSFETLGTPSMPGLKTEQSDRPARADGIDGVVRMDPLTIRLVERARDRHYSPQPRCQQGTQRKRASTSVEHDRTTGGGRASSQEAESRSPGTGIQDPCPGKRGDASKLRRQQKRDHLELEPCCRRSLKASRCAF